MPVIDERGVRGRVVIGAFEGVRSPVKVFSDTLYADINLDAGREVSVCRRA
jgi:redox-sensitive bicupin YhaK (pirin superfamily)